MAIGSCRVAEIELYSCGWRSTLIVCGRLHVPRQDNPAQGRARLSIRLVRHPQEKCLGNVHRVQQHVVSGVDHVSLGPRGTTARRELISFLQDPLHVEGCTVLTEAVPHHHANDDYSYKVPRRPFESARLDAELKVRYPLQSVV